VYRVSLCWSDDADRNNYRDAFTTWSVRDVTFPTPRCRSQLTFALPTGALGDGGCSGCSDCGVGVTSAISPDRPTAGPHPKICFRVGKLITAVDVTTSQTEETTSHATTTRTTTTTLDSSSILLPADVRTTRVRLARSRFVVCHPQTAQMLTSQALFSVSLVSRLPACPLAVRGTAALTGFSQRRCSDLVHTVSPFVSTSVSRTQRLPVVRQSFDVMSSDTAGRRVHRHFRSCVSSRSTPSPIAIHGFLELDGNTDFRNLHSFVARC
jgi:hypothetical protein